MSTKKKLINRLLSYPRDFTYDELLSLLRYLGYEEDTCGKTSGSARCFVKAGCRDIRLHKPHNRRELLLYQIKEIIDILKEDQLI